MGAGLPSMISALDPGYIVAPSLSSSEELSEFEFLSLGCISTFY